MGKVKIENRGVSRAITSREYKLILNSDEITNHEKYANKLWKEIKGLVENLDGIVLEEQLDVKIKTTKYLDTHDHLLKKNNFILRQRKDHDDNNYKVTLKYRSPDRYLSSDINISNNRDADIKFEEDILCSSNKYSLSASYTVKNKPKIKNLYDISDNYPLKALLDLPIDTTFETVNSFNAHEVTKYLGKIRFSNGHKVKFCINYWFEKSGEYEQPLLAELAFDYDLISSKDKRKGYVWSSSSIENFHILTVKSMNTLFSTLKKSERVNLQGSTKTNYVYNL